MQKITPCLWFDNQPEEAMDFYVSLFEDSKILNVSRSSEIKQLHGVEPKAIAVLRDTLAARGLSFAAEKQSQPGGELR